MSHAKVVRTCACVVLFSLSIERIKSICALIKSVTLLLITKKKTQIQIGNE